MSRAAVRPPNSESLRHHASLRLLIGPYSYQIETDDKTSSFRVSDDKSSITADLAWAIGVGHMGQTYLYEQGGSYYESHVSFYAVPQALDITPGQPRTVPRSLAEAAGRPMPADESQRCFGCHTTASTTSSKFDPASLFPGVTCEACHGPGASHVAAAKSGIEGLAETLIFNPKRLNRVESVDFCGACHRTWEDVVANGQVGLGIFNVRFAPYRLENSKCWKKGDSRLTCVACHDPHDPLSHDPGSYDATCVQCHSKTAALGKSRSHATASCPVASKNCVTCHMPKYEPPTLHSSFTDHWIRIVRPQKPYPE